LPGATKYGWLKHDPEKWTPVFRKDHAEKIKQSGMAIRRKAIPLCDRFHKPVGARWNFHPMHSRESVQELAS